MIDYILEHDLKEGNALPTIDAMVDMLSVSRVTYREAMLYLRGLGVVTSKRGSCYRVADFDPARIFETALPLYMNSQENLNETAKLRGFLEVGVVSTVAANADEKLKTAIDETNLSLERLLERSDASLREYEELEAGFHSLIANASECCLLKSIMSALFKYIYKTPNAKIPEEMRTNLRRTNAEHKLIASAIRLNDPDAALMAMRNHLSGNSLLGRVEEGVGKC